MAREGWYLPELQAQPFFFTAGLKACYGGELRYRLDLRLLSGWNGSDVVESCALQQVHTPEFPSPTAFVWVRI